MNLNRGIFMLLKYLFIIMLGTSTFAYSCQMVYEENCSVTYITNDDLSKIQSGWDCCYNGWTYWKCCQCQYLNGYAFNTCQNCYKEKCH